jgi:F-type H+-transporting ATPase subunit epsilon
LLKVRILSTNGLVYEGQASEVYFPSASGPLGILPGHTPFIAALAEVGIIRLSDELRADHYFVVRRGALEVKPDEVIALSEDCVSAASYEEAQALVKKAPALRSFQGNDIKRAEAALTSEYAAGEAKPYNGAVKKG